MRNGRGRALSRLGALLLVLALLLAPRLTALAGWGGSSTTLIAVGDIADCGSDPKNTFDAGKAKRSEETAALVKKVSSDPNAPILALGDTVYTRGTPDQFNDCFNVTWGSVKSRVYPAPGNHEYYYTNPHTQQNDAAPYFAAFGARAGKPGEGWYSFDYAGWHIIALNTNGSPTSSIEGEDGDGVQGGPRPIPCGYIACDANSAQGKWLAADLKASKATCSLAFWHHPRFSSGGHGDNPEVQPLWKMLNKAGVDVVLNGHDHDYQVFKPLSAKGQVNKKSGMREFVVGTGGSSEPGKVGKQPKSSQYAVDGVFGVLVLSLTPTGYSWQYRTTPNGTVLDSGSGTCR